jgi:Inner membrane component of T3SS, cytoplasmic domain
MENGRFLSLVVLTGLHTGAIVPLQGDTFTIGRGATCDILLRDPGIVEQHANISLVKSRFRLRSIHGPILHAPRSWRFMPYGAVRFEEVFMLGNVAMVITTVAEGFAATQQRFSRQIHLVQAATEQIARQKLKPLLTNRLAAGLSALALAGVAAIAASHVKRNLEPGAKSQHAAIDEAVTDPLAGFSERRELNVSSVENTTVVSGYVPSWQDYVKLKAKLSSQDARSTVHVFVVNELVAHARTLLATGQHDAMVTYGGWGLLHISGTTKDLEKLKAQVAGLPGLLPGVTSVEIGEIAIEKAMPNQQAQNGLPRLANHAVNGLMSGPQKFFSSGDTRFIAGATFDKDLVVQSMDADKITFQHQGQPWVMKLNASSNIQIR